MEDFARLSLALLIFLGKNVIINIPFGTHVNAYPSKVQIINKS